MMESLVFMGRDTDVRAATSSPDIRLRMNTPEADLTVLVKVCVCM